MVVLKSPTNRRPRMVSFDAALRHVKRDVDGLLDPRAIHALCEAHRHAWRPGPLGPAATLGLMLRQVAEGNVAGGQVVRMAGGTFSESAWCQARQRLPLEVLQEVGLDVAARVRESPGVGPSWHGRRVRLIDASNFSMPDTPGLRAYFGDLPGQKPGCGFPVAHCLMVFGKEGGELAYSGRVAAQDRRPAPRVAGARTGDSAGGRAAGR